MRDPGDFVKCLGNVAESAVQRIEAEWFFSDLSARVTRFVWWYRGISELPMDMTIDRSSTGFGTVVPEQVCHD